MNKETLTILYDGECPFCKRYVHMVRLRENFDVKLIDARNDSTLKKKATDMGYDLDAGMLVEYDGKYYFGSQAVFLLSSLTTPLNFFNKLMKKLFASEKMAAVVYPILAFFRRMTLFILQNGLIDNLPKKTKKKVCGFFDDCSVREIISNPVIIADLCIRLTAFCLLFTIIYSWKLWFPAERLLAPAPLAPWFAEWQPVLSQIAVVAVLAICGTLFIRPQKRRLGIALTALMAFLIVQDELRWQPFVYMYTFILFAGAFIPQVPEQKHFAAWRLMIVGIYFWAGFYKICTAFVLQVFPWFVQPIGLSKELVFYLSCAVPFLECLIGIFLFIPRLRAFGVIMATCMLIIVLYCLGPLGHNWGMIVWPWNVLLHALEAILFLYFRQPLLQKTVWRDKIALTSIVLFWVVPTLGAFDKWGCYPSFMLYSGLPATADIRFDPREDMSFLPTGAQAELGPDSKIDLIFISGYEYHVAIAPGRKGYMTMVTAAKGLCRYLAYPEEASITVHKLPHFWSMAYDHIERSLCPQKT